MYYPGLLSLFLWMLVKSFLGLRHCTRSFRYKENFYFHIIDEEAEFLRPEMTIQGHTANAVWLLILSSQPQSSTGSPGWGLSKAVLISSFCISPLAVSWPAERPPCSLSTEIPSRSHPEVMGLKADKRAIMKTSKSAGRAPSTVRRGICLLNTL